MKLYLSVIGLSVFVVSAVNILFNTSTWYYVILAVVLCTVAQFALDGLVAIIINKMPDSLFSVNNHLYDVLEHEQKLYKKLKVRLWKDKIWELGGLGGFSKKRLVNPNSPEYIEKFIIECNKGVLTHRLSYPVGFVPILLMPDELAFTVALPVAIVNLVLNILPTMALRYNTPKLKSLLKRMNRKNDAKQNIMLYNL